MKLLEDSEMTLMSSLNCPKCPQRTRKEDWEVYNTKKNFNYLKCKFCGTTFKLSRRKIKHSEDYKYFECVSLEENYAYRGYYINEKTFEKNRVKFQIQKMYSDRYFLEIDDFLI